jgi:hypothetical protein
VHPVKIYGALALDESLRAVVIHAEQGDAVDAASASAFRDRLVVLDIKDPQPEVWAASALAAAQLG